ncbi:hypothetical protein ANO11243_076960 [Dothideomycetidae sp. 11243]|nr:hypothetical protein ANO11243_076960 [fungal sp. No.11243]
MSGQDCPGKAPPQAGQKRKDAPSESAGNSSKRTKPNSGKNHSQQQSKKGGNQHAGQRDKQGQTGKSFKNKAQQNARTLVTQTTSKAFKDGKLDVDRFVKAREFEIRALQDGIQRSQLARHRRAFQQVPRDMRRRTGAWDVKRLPKQKRAKAAREIIEDNTPTGKARKKKPTRHMRLRQETVKKLRALGAKRKAAKGAADEVKVLQPGGENIVPIAGTAVKTRDARVKKNMLRDPPPVKARYKKRQVHKTWLPTHIFHAKRAHMSSPKEPVWRFSLPISPTAKSYRPTHRGAAERGAIAWDVSYMSTVGLEGVEASLLGLLKGLHAVTPEGVYKRLWMSGVRTWQGWLSTREDATKPIGSVTVIWKAEEDIEEASQPEGNTALPPKKAAKRKLMVRVHPSAFHQLWEEVIRLCKVQKPQVTAEDLRYEVGSIEVLGPGSTEALQAVLRPTEDGEEPNPRLRHPPRTVKLPTDPQKLVKSIFDFDTRQKASRQALFENKDRRAAVAAMQSQKAINRRKTESAPGEYPSARPTDPSIPLVLFASSLGTSLESATKRSRTVAWTILLPWKAVSAVWLSLMYYPLSSGGQPQLGGLDQQRQLAFEHGVPWWPGDFPGTTAGDEWIARETEDRKKSWERRPKSRRVAFDTLDLGHEKKGELGCGWGMPFELLREDEKPNDTSVDAMDVDDAPGQPAPAQMQLLLPALARSFLSPKGEAKAPPTALFTVRVSLIGRGHPQPCARVYALPSDPHQLKRWAALIPNKGAQRRAGHRPAPPVSDIASLARQLLAGDKKEDAEDWPPVPGQEELVGFVTSGGFNLREGKGTGIASFGLERVRRRWVGVTDDKLKKLCIVRNSGEKVSRLAAWEMI